MSDFDQYKLLIMHELKCLREGQDEIKALLNAHIDLENTKWNAAEASRVKINIMWAGLALLITPLFNYLITKISIGGNLR